MTTIHLTYNGPEPSPKSKAHIKHLLMQEKNWKQINEVQVTE